MQATNQPVDAQHPGSTEMFDIRKRKAGLERIILDWHLWQQRNINCAPDIASGNTFKAVVHDHFTYSRARASSEFEAECRTSRTPDRVDADGARA